MDSHFTTAERQRWMAVLAHCPPQALAERWQALNLRPEYDTLRPAETGLVQLKARAGATGATFFAGDATLTRAAVRLASGICGYSWVLGRDKPHAERCALVDALMQDKQHYPTLLETLINPLAANREARQRQREAEVNASRVDFFTLVRGDNE